MECPLEICTSFLSKMPGVTVAPVNSKHQIALEALPMLSLRFFPQFVVDYTTNVCLLMMVASVVKRSDA